MTGSEIMIFNSGPYLRLKTMWTSLNSIPIVVLCFLLSSCKNENIDPVETQNDSQVSMLKENPSLILREQIQPTEVDSFWLATNGAILVKGKALQVNNPTESKFILTSDTILYCILPSRMIDSITDRMDSNIHQRFVDSRESLIDPSFIIEISNDPPFVTRITNSYDQIIFYPPIKDGDLKFINLTKNFSLAFDHLNPSPTILDMLNLFGVNELANSINLTDIRLVFVGERSIANYEIGDEDLSLGGPEYLLSFKAGELIELSHARMLGLAKMYQEYGEINTTLLSEG